MLSFIWTDSSHPSKSPTAVDLSKKLSQTGIKCIPLDEILVKLPDNSSMNFSAFGLLKRVSGKRHPRTLNGLRTRFKRKGGVGSNPREGMDTRKCIVPLQHRGTLNSRRAASPLVRLMEREEEKWEDSDHI
ncbi:hypothetical protein TNCV_1400251 [Trichonephila clavipes]|nr:hypothetical protein TNCV_1400251 [Trichonephila clavipes]